MDFTPLGLVIATLGAAQAVLGVTQALLAAVEVGLRAVEGNLGAIWTAGGNIWIGFHAFMDGVGLIEAGLGADPDLRWSSVIDLIIRIWASFVGILQQLAYIRSQLTRV